MSEIPSTEGTSLLAALADPDCRAILAATADAPRTAGELATDCEIPASTTYRKVETLTELGLVDERIRLQRAGRCPSEYSLATEAVRVDLGEGRVTVVENGETVRSSDVPADANLAVPDGGSPASGDAEVRDASHHERLRDIFVNVTGTDSVVEQQDEGLASRTTTVIDGTQGEVLSESLVATFRDDGLSETYAEPDVEGPPG